ncbi:MAG: hypothetical protein FWC24_05605, partial [Treponema sp.]|nr:hypothetical protein [Treponema sp.]
RQGGLYAVLPGRTAWTERRRLFRLTAKAVSIASVKKCHDRLAPVGLRTARLYDMIVGEV